MPEIERLKVRTMAQCSSTDRAEVERQPIPSPSKDPSHQYLRRGDLVKISQCGIEKSKRLKDKEGDLGRVVKCNAIDDNDSPSSFLYDVEFILGGRLSGCEREDLVYRTADEEGMTDAVDNRRRKRKPTDFMEDVARMEATKRQFRQQQQKSQQKQQKSADVLKQSATKRKKETTSNESSKKSATSDGKSKASKLKKAPKSQSKTTEINEKDNTSSIKRRNDNKLDNSNHGMDEGSTSNSALDLFERQMREFNRFLSRLQHKVDVYRHFWQDTPSEFDEIYENNAHEFKTSSHADNASEEFENSLPSSMSVDSRENVHKSADLCLDPKQERVDFPSHPPYNWHILQHRLENGRYIIDRGYQEEQERFALFGEYYESLPPERRPKRLYKAPRIFHPEFEIKAKTMENELDNQRVAHAFGIDWDAFRNDVIGMCDWAISRSDPNDDEDVGQRGSLSHTVKKIKENLDQAYERTGKRHAMEMMLADDRLKFSRAIESYTNKEPAMQTWRKEPFPERRYERVTSDAVCDGLSKVDEKIATYELRTNLPDSFIGQSYHYNDTSLSEVWMKSVVDERETIRGNKQRTDAKKEAALALAADEGVTRAQVNASIQALLVAVQDRVMTEKKVLQQPELTSDNWLSESLMNSVEPSNTEANNNSGSETETSTDDQNEAATSPQIVEKPVWGLDCYTRRNITVCLELEFDTDISLSFVEKWLLPAINACPVKLAQHVGNAARILEGLPFDSSLADDQEQDNRIMEDVPSVEEWSRNLLARSLLNKIRNFGPPWLKAAANRLRRARDALGPDFFRVHPKGNGSILLAEKVDANRLVTFYHGELYPSWRWGEKMDAIDITQQRKDLKPALPDFYNMALERPQKDPRGYGLLFVDASRKAGHGSCLSHSCVPTCEVRVAAVNGELCLAMTTLRELECGEELTFDYNAVTESLNEYRSAVCLCGYGRCRGSFLHFATADCYQQILNRNSPIASRFASLVKGSMKKVMSEDDEKVLRCHGFQTAAFGAISVNRREVSKYGAVESLADSMEFVPVWLRTYIADTLRYIEYERRALPIALICDNRSKDEKAADLNDASEPQNDDSPAKEPKPETSFFYFSRTQTQLLNKLLEEDGFPSSLVGLQRKHALQKVASQYWQKLDETEKNHWKEKAREDFEKKLKLVEKKRGPREHQKKTPKETKQSKTENSADESSGISFQDADAEGLSAMEQRIQQLTQTLSRVGRVLDRHREDLFRSSPLELSFSENMNEIMRNFVHQPLTVLSDIDVVGWIWNSKGGVVSSLLDGVARSRASRPNLLVNLTNIKNKFSFLEECGDPTDKNGERNDPTEIPVENIRGELKEALLEMRNSILDELKQMSATYKTFKNKKMLLKSSTKQTLSESCKNEAGGSETEIRVDNTPSLDFDDSGKSIQTKPKDEDANHCKDVKSCADHVSPSSFEETISGDDKSTSTNHSQVMLDSLVAQFGSWVMHYGERFVLEASADLLLLYAETSNFFVMKPYQKLESTPVEVYARELGNSVPKSVVDEDFEERRDISGKGNPTVDQCTNDNLTSCKEHNPKSAKATKDNDVCQPDEIVAKVTVKYQGDYVVSQLLQWYNGGIGQKPGLPDLLGCTVLPSMSGCWNSELLSNARLKSEKRTLYDTKVRPRLAEWFQDQYERGNPWPADIRKAFVEKGCTSDASSDCDTAFVAFGTPIIDFLVSGDETNIATILYALDAEEKVTVKPSTDGLLSSVDKGRPAQAVSTWVQCEECEKWRKIPWYVDADMLPEKFYCKDNKWNPSSSSCDDPEDSWDEADALVGADGKVEGSPVKNMVPEESGAVDNEKCFRIGARFDVRRSGKKKFTIGTVVKTDFSGIRKRILFHFVKTTSDRNEWIDFGSDRIAPLSTMTLPPKAKRVLTNEDSETSILDYKNFVVGAKFDVRRSDNKYYSLAIVTHVDSSTAPKRIKFHFAKSSTCRDEWVDFGSDRIAPLNTKSKERNLEDSKSKKKNASFGKPVKKREEPQSEGDAEHEMDCTMIDKTKGNNVFSGNPTKKRKEKQSEGEAEPEMDCTLPDSNSVTSDNLNVKSLTEKKVVKSKNGKKTKLLDESSRVQNVQSDREGGNESKAPNSSIRCLSSKVKSKNGISGQSCNNDNGDTIDMLSRKEKFSIGARFDVQRAGKVNYCVGVVKEVDSSESTPRILFHFPKMHVKFDEWIEVGSPRICALGTKVSQTKVQLVVKKKNTNLEIIKKRSEFSGCDDKKIQKGLASSSCDDDNMIDRKTSTFLSVAPQVGKSNHIDNTIPVSPQEKDQMLSNSSIHTLNLAELSEAVPLPECDSPMLCKSERKENLLRSSSLNCPTAFGALRFAGQMENIDHDQIRRSGTGIHYGINPEFSQPPHVSTHTVSGTILDSCTPFAMRTSKVNPKVVTREDCSKVCPSPSIVEFQASQSLQDWTHSSSIRGSFYGNIQQWNGQTHNATSIQVNQTLSPRSRLQGYLGFPESTQSFDHAPRVQESAFDKLLMLASASHGQADGHGAMSWRGPIPESAQSFNGISSHHRHDFVGNHVNNSQVTYNQNGDHINDGHFGSRKKSDNRFFSNQFAG